MADNYLTCSAEKGSIHISEDVIAVIVAAAVSEVEGVAGLSGNISSELSDFLGKKTIAKGIKVRFHEDVIVIDVIVMLRYGSPITQTAEKIQEAVISAVEAMTGQTQPTVHVHVGGVAFERDLRTESPSKK